jgi:hypothetical protein
MEVTNQQEGPWWGRLTLPTPRGSEGAQQPQHSTPGAVVMEEAPSNLSINRSNLNISTVPHKQLRSKFRSDPNHHHTPHPLRNPPLLRVGRKLEDEDGGHRQAHQLQKRVDDRDAVHHIDGSYGRGGGVGQGGGE